MFKGVQPLLEVAGLLDRMIKAAFATPDITAIDELQKRVRSDPQVKRLFRAALEHVGVEAARSYWDSIYLRVVPPVEGDAERQIGRIGFHRDTWSSNVPQQTNWWTTIRPLSAERTIAFYPGYWSRPIANSENAPDHILIKRDAESQGELLSDPWTPPRRISLFHGDDRVHHFLGGSLRARLLPYLGREQSAIFPSG